MKLAVWSCIRRIHHFRMNFDWKAQLLRVGSGHITPWHRWRLSSNTHTMCLPRGHWDIFSLNISWIWTCSWSKCCLMSLILSLIDSFICVSYNSEHFLDHPETVQSEDVLCWSHFGQFRIFGPSLWVSSVDTSGVQHKSKQIISSMHPQNSRHAILHPSRV